MFKRNDSYRELDLFSTTNTLSNRKAKLLERSIEDSFLKNIFSKINEDDFSVLFSKNKSRPNVPVNQLVGSLILKHLYNWTYAELFRNLNFNILTRHAIGIESINEEVYSEASLYNFQNRVIQYFGETGTDLLSNVFDQLTEGQLKEFGVKTNIQRGDSFLIGSNIFNYSRLQLLIEVLLRLYRILEDEDKHKYSEIVNSYTKQTAGQYIYKIEKDELPGEIEKLAGIYYKLYDLLKAKYADVAIFLMFERVLNEHFTKIDNKIDVIPPKELHSALMSPDDEEATFRHKRTIKSKGYVGHVTETANPDNKLNLITDVVVVPNNIDDAKILEERLPEMVTKTPDLDEYHCDGNYGNAEVDKLMDEYNITQIPTAIRGATSSVKIDIICDDDNNYSVKCEGGQLIKAEGVRSGKRLKAVFDFNKCLSCKLNNICKIQSIKSRKGTTKRVWYFDEGNILRYQRNQNIYLIPKERLKIRANVEATVKEVKRGIKNGKVRIRRKLRVMLYLYMTSIAVNLTRIHKLELVTWQKSKNCSAFYCKTKIVMIHNLIFQIFSNVTA